MKKFFCVIGFILLFLMGVVGFEDFPMCKDN